MDDEALGYLKRSGDIVARLRKEVPGLVRPGEKAIKICETIEAKIRESGGKPAFPVNVGINEVAAHYTSPPSDTLTIPRSSLVKVDFGVHVNGYVTDTAVTVLFDPSLEPLARASSDALQNAIRAFKPGVKLSEIGRIVQSTIKKYGLRPISNLTGHKIERYTIHAGKSVPNIPELDGGKIMKGEVYAIEPFVTLSQAKGFVTDGAGSYIYRFVKNKGVKDDSSKKMLDYISEKFSTLPFAARWLQPVFSADVARIALRDLLQNHCVTAYPVLVEETSKPVAQSEHTVLVNEEDCTILTGS